MSLSIFIFSTLICLAKSGWLSIAARKEDKWHMASRCRERVPLAPCHPPTAPHTIVFPPPTDWVPQKHAQAALFPLGKQPAGQVPEPPPRCLESRSASPMPTPQELSSPEHLRL